jgi:hypothetical protein
LDLLVILSIGAVALMLIWSACDRLPHPPQASMPSKAVCGMPA